MKRKGNQTEQIASLDNLYLAYTKAKRGKACKKEVLEFTKNFDANIEKLRTEILDGNAGVEHYHYFKIYDPKERTICAASFSERILHHAIMNVCHDTFDRNLIADTYATRKGKGVYAALDRAKSALIKHKYAVKLDFRKYYDSISHKVLKAKLCRKFKDKRLLHILCQTIDLLSHLPTSHTTVRAVRHTAVSCFYTLRRVASCFQSSLRDTSLLFYCRIPSYRVNREFLFGHLTTKDSQGSSHLLLHCTIQSFPIDSPCLGYYDLC